MIEKKILLLVSGAITLLLLILDQIGTDRLCGGRQYTECMQNLHSLLTIFIPVTAVFLAIVVFYWTREEVYQAWFRFLRWWIPLSVLLILVTPEYGGGLINPVSKGTVAVFLSALFVLISMIIITYKYWRPSR